MKTTTAIKITTVTLVLLIAGFFLDLITIKNYNVFDWSYLSVVCANVCILCYEKDKKKSEDAAENAATATAAIR